MLDNMKTEKLKILIKEVLSELYNRGSNASDTYDDYEIEFESLVIPGLSTETESVNVSVSIGYNFDAGHEATGMFGPPERSSPGEGASVEIVDYWPTSVRVVDAAGKETEYNPDKLTSEQQTILKKAIEDHVSQNENTINDRILNTIDVDSGSSEPDYNDVDETTHPQDDENRKLKASGNRMVESLIAWGINIEKWNIYEMDKNTIMLQLYFKLIKSKAIWTLLNMMARHNGDLRMYPDKDFIGVDIKIDKKNLR
jgi:hypothetical protein